MNDATTTLTRAGAAWRISAGGDGAADGATGAVAVWVDPECRGFGAQAAEGTNAVPCIGLAEQNAMKAHVGRGAPPTELVIS